MPDLETSLSYCTYCPKLCRHTCPVSNVEARETVIPQAKMATMRRLRLLDDAGRAAPEVRDETEALYACTGCGACGEFCNHHIAVGPSLMRGREEAEREGRGHPALADIIPRFEAHTAAAAAHVREHVPARRRPAEAQVAFLPGCEDPGIASTLLALCDRLGAEYVAVADVPRACGGYPLWAAGQHDAFRLYAERFAEDVRGFARLVVHCPSCAWLMKTEYARFGVPLAPKIEHTTELLETFAERLPVKQKRGRAHYHDPCYLGRHQGLYDPPRRLAARAVDELHEFSRARAEAECSGGGGLLPVTMPSTAEAIAERRLEEVREAPAPLDKKSKRTVVTACPTCVRQLRRDDVETVDLVALLEEATRPDSGGEP
jgi:Fe-S oxidoreductase